ncbi:MAG: Spx/MgsR family RNA polymerase-binding regulatory protein [Pseudomonadota bacterium]
MTIVVYGLKNCDSCKKALRHLAERTIEAALIDVRATPPTAQQLRAWCVRFGRDALVNKRSTTWRNLTDNDKHILSDEDAVALLVAQPTLMKRPVIETQDHALLGFNADELDAFLDR